MNPTQIRALNKAIKTHKKTRLLRLKGSTEEEAEVLKEDPNIVATMTKYYVEQILKKELPFKITKAWVSLMF